MAKREPDNLAKDAAKALAAGMSYGRWKAMHPETKVDNPQDDEIPDDWKLCKYCGKPFKPRGSSKQLYCEAGCQLAASRERDRERKREYARAYAEKRRAEQKGA